ncbi:MAG TPA: TonB-dependent receptor [Steroidobacteraceae bacterium]|nr:TonB-dependent receptor [Steroidobacteraceae bacterium]
MITRWKVDCGRVVTVLCAAACAQAYAADTPRGQALEEVVVTATKRGETDIQKTAESIYAVGGADLSLKRETTFEAFAGSVPGLQFQNLGPGDSEYIIRGINGSGPSVVGAYLDEYVITASDQQDGGGKNAPIQLVDVERVEVLNGPQGTLYGSNSMAGNIRFITRKPDASAFAAYGEADWSSIEDGGSGYGITAVINAPLVNDKLAVRLVGYREDRDGWIDQTRLERTSGGNTTFDGRAEDINSTEITGGRLSVRWTPSDALTIDALYIKQNLDSDGSPRFTSKGVPAYPDQPPEIASLPGNTGFTPLPGLGSFTPGRDFINTDITRSPRKDDFDLFGATARYDTGFGNVSLAASQYKHDIDFAFDSTPILLFFGVPIPGVTQQPQEYKTKMAELRFASDFDSPFNFVTGAYYQKDENEFNVHVVTTDGNGGPMPFNPLNSDDALLAGGNTFFGRTRADEVEQKAVFGEATFKFADRWTLLAGLRWSEADLQAIQATLHAFAPTGPVEVDDDQVIGTTVNGNEVGLLKQDGSKTLPKVSLSLQATDDVLWYALYSEGFRVGGINNGNQPFAPGIPQTFDSDDLKNYEVGIKSRWVEDRLQLNATVFHIKWNDIQVEPRDPVGNIPFTTNGGAAKVTGLEWSLDSLLTDQVSLEFTGTYFFEHELSEDQPVLPGASPFVIVGRKGDEIPNTPDLQLYAALRYQVPIAGRETTFSLDATYRGKTNTEFVPSSPFNIALDSYTVLNAVARVELTDKVQVGLFVKNLTDELALYDGVGTFQDPEAVVSAQPRTIGVNARVSF